METDYKVRLDIFEGPLDLLLYLIKQRRDRHLRYLARAHHEAVPRIPAGIQGAEHRDRRRVHRHGGESDLLKSRSLLPVDQQPPEEDVDEDDPRWELIRQLIEYKKFKEAAEQLQVRQLEQEKIFSRIAAPTTLRARRCVSVKLEFSS